MDRDGGGTGVLGGGGGAEVVLRVLGVLIRRWTLIQG